jgi:hypothetical protein
MCSKPDCRSDYPPARSHADCRAVAHLRAFRRSAVNLLQLRVINFRSENLLNSVQISAVSICRELKLVSSEASGKRICGSVARDILGDRRSQLGRLGGIDRRLQSNPKSHIEHVIPGFENCNERVAQDVFYLRNDRAISDRILFRHERGAIRGLNRLG